MLRPTKTTINLKAIEHNFLLTKNTVNSFSSKRIKIMAVVKANAYGHGAPQVANALARIGADEFAVATLQEAIELRNNNVILPILVLSPILTSVAKAVVQYDLQQAIFSCDTIEAINIEAQKQSKKASIHIKIDTGMHRLGVSTQSELEKILQCIQKCDNINLTGAYTHFACSDDVEKSINKIQLERFKNFVTIIRKYGFDPCFHAANSNAILAQNAFDMVRAGISLYGYAQYQNGLQKAMSVQTKIMQIKTIQKGEGVGYGLDFVAEKETKIAILPIGYADGFFRAYAKNGRVIVNNQYANIIGRICMDLSMIDITNISSKLYDDVIIMGTSKQGEMLKQNSIFANELAKRANTIYYEVLTGFDSRIEKQFVN